MGTRARVGTTALTRGYDVDALLSSVGNPHLRVNSDTKIALEGAGLHNATLLMNSWRPDTTWHKTTEELMQEKPITIKLPRELIKVTQANLDSAQSNSFFGRAIRVTSSGPEDEVPYQSMLLSDEFELNNKVIPPFADLIELNPPVRLTWEQWRMMLTAAITLYQAGKDINYKNIIASNRRIHKDICKALITTKEFGEALELRGVTATWLGLSEKQMLTLSLLTDYTDRRSIRAKLEACDVKGWEFKAWQANPIFKSAYRQSSEQLFEDAQPAVNVSLATNAVAGDLPSQKYFNEMSGRWNPAQQNVADVRTVLTAVVDVLTSTIDDPELLKKIAGRLSMVMAANGLQPVNSNTGSNKEIA